MMELAVGLNGSRGKRLQGGGVDDEAEVGD